MDSIEIDYQNLLAEYEGAVNAYGSSVRALIAARSSFAAKGSARFKLAMDAVSVAHRKCYDLHTRLGDARKKSGFNMSEPTELDETEQLLHAEFYECSRELAVAEEKLNNPRRSLLYDEYMKLRKKADVVIALTHDPKLDDLALMEALKTPAFYVGALGSRRNNQARRERLKEFDLNDAELARLHGPVGIYIGSRTPPEIAVSILAEVTAAKNGVSLPTLLQVEGAKAAREIAASGGTACSV